MTILKPIDRPRRSCEQPLADIDRPTIARRAAAQAAARKHAAIEADVDLVAAVLAGHGIPDRSAAEHVIEILASRGRLR